MHNALSPPILPWPMSRQLYEKSTIYPCFYFKWYRATWGAKTDTYNCDCEWREAKTLDDPHCCKSMSALVKLYYRAVSIEITRRPQLGWQHSTSLCDLVCTNDGKKRSNVSWRGKLTRQNAMSHIRFYILPWEADHKWQLFYPGLCFPVV
jgi:hypothetical protein